MADKNDSLYLRPIDSLTMVDRVEFRIRQYLTKQKLEPGDTIPKETELAEALGVSRNVVREAISRLRMQGLVDSRKKRGMVFSNPDLLSGIERLMDPTILGKENLQDIFEMRLVIEMGIAELLFKRKIEEDIKELERIAEDQEEKEANIFTARQERNFHGKIYKITKNKTLQRFQNMLLPIFEHISSYESRLNGSSQVGKVSHKDLVEILKNGNPKEYRIGMYEHLKPHFENLSR
jgi:DNA-binding FadR family transcriptional regulator